MSTSTPSPSGPLPRLLVLISGNGSNLQALIDSTTSDPPTLSASVIHVISNKRNAYGLTRARLANISTSYHNLLPYTKPRDGTPVHANPREVYDADLARLIISQAPDLVVCAGWMHILSPTALEPLDEKGIGIINLHPALPGQFDGTHAIQRAYEAFHRGEITKTGVMIHHVVTAVDRGKPILVREVELRKEESLEELEERIHSIEHGAIVEATRLALEERSKARLTAQ